MAAWLRGRSGNSNSMEDILILYENDKIMSHKSFINASNSKTNYLYCYETNTYNARTAGNY